MNEGENREKKVAFTDELKELRADRRPESGSGSERSSACW